MTANKERWIRPDIAAMEPYTPILPFDVLSRQLGRHVNDIVKLDANENPYGPSPAALAALQAERWYHIYPDPDATALREALAARLNFPAERLLAGMGADELIDLVMRATLSPGDLVLNCPPTFGMYAFSTAVNQGRLFDLPRFADFTVDIPAIKSAIAANPAAKLLFLCSPNNPDGGVIKDRELRALLELPVLIVLDEAYIEFAEAGGFFSRISWALEHENLIVLRTFSKLAGLAGLRLGYGAFPSWLLPHLRKIKQPYNANVAATSAAIASLKEPAWMDEKVDLLVAERRRMVAELARFPFLDPYPSHANFVLFRVRGRSAALLKEELAALGVLVRYFSKPGVDNCIRISAGRPADTGRLLAALTIIADRHEE
ncbi:MAG: histidinol-phosphate transaminase [Candidatus Promineifilaceae bacterium]